MLMKPAPHRLPSVPFSAATYTIAIMVLMAGACYHIWHYVILALANWRFPCLPR